MEKHTIYLAGGCFWGMEAFMRQLPGVLEVRLDQSSGDLAVRYDTGGTSRELIRERLNRLGCFFVQTSLEQLTS